MLSKIKSAVKSAVTGVKQSANKAWNRVKETAGQIKNTVVNTVKQIGTALKKVDTARKAGETEGQWKNRVAQEKAAKSGAKADLISPDGLMNMAGLVTGILNPIQFLSAGTAGLMLTGIDEFRFSYRDYRFQKAAGIMDDSVFGEAFYQAMNFVYQQEVKACAAYEYCQKQTECAKESWSRVV